MRQWMWTLLIAGGLGLGATGCKQRENRMEREPGPLGSEWQPRQDAPPETVDLLGGERPMDEEFLGTVTATERGGFTARDDDGMEHPFVVNEDTRFVKDGQPVARTQLREGSQVRTTYDATQGPWIASQVDIYAGTPSRDRPTEPPKP